MAALPTRKCLALIIALSTLFIFLSWFSFSNLDSTFFSHSLEAKAYYNFCGKYGAHTIALLLYFFGSSSLIIVLIGMSLALRQWDYIYDRVSCGMREVALMGLLFVCSLLQSLFKVEFKTGVFPGGLFGKSGMNILRKFFDAELILLVLFFALWGISTLVFGFACMRPLKRLVRWIQVTLPGIPHRLQDAREQFVNLSKSPRYIIGSLQQYSTTLFSQIFPDFFTEKYDVEAVRFEEAVYDVEFWQDFIAPEQPVVKNVGVEQDMPKSGDFMELLEGQEASCMQDYPEALIAEPYNKPDIHLFRSTKKTAIDRKDMQEHKERARILEDKLERFGIHGKVVAISSGPVVTLFEYEPESDIAISKILAREDDLALALQALSLRIIAPIPGRAVVGFEVAHSHRKMVLYADCITSPVYTETKAKLPLVIGHDTIGGEVVLDLATMPHLLVAGSTGSGKSVALSGMLVSLLCHTTPEEMRFILIDPKRLEFSPYADIPHLLFPIVTDPATAVAVLSWAVKTMEERYEAMAEAGVRTLSDYRTQTKEPMPYIVIVIDELADLMMTAGKEVESLIARLAQMARAAGIHLIIATQRPSVDVITGLIKVNFPARIAFKVTSKVDSRTILDAMGAEKLLGKGDLLFLDTQGSLHRMHGAYVTDEEISKVVHHIKQQRDVMYEELPTKSALDADVRGEDEALYQEVLTFVKTIDEISISSLQRKFRIGYNRSARMMQLLESHGVIMPSQGGKMRKVIRQ